jgi:hypothetical protein
MEVTVVTQVNLTGGDLNHKADDMRVHDRIFSGQASLETHINL